jgi:hypothetical protein
MNTIRDLTVLLHIYYPGSWAIIRSKCETIIRQASNIIITACHDDVIGEIPPAGNIIILKVPNKGKDIGGKLAAISYYLHFCKKTEYLIFLHDKISPQTINAEYWLESLYRVFEHSNFNRAMRRLARNRRIGIIGSKAFLRSEFIPSKKQFATINDEPIRQLIRTYRLSCRRYRFIAGTIFIAKSSIFECFFTDHPALKVREGLESGNVLDLFHGTLTHSWERLFCFIAEDRGYVVKGM